MQGSRFKTIRTVCPMNCYGGCAMEAVLDGDKPIRIEGASGNPITREKLCAKGYSFLKMIDDPNRIRHPLKRIGERGKGGFVRISWDEAIQEIYARMGSLRDAYGPESIFWYVGSGNLNGVMENVARNFWNQFGGYTGTRGALCDPAGVAAITQTYGKVAFNSPDDFQNAKLILLWGFNPANTSIHFMHFINEAVKRGASLVTIDPIRNESSLNSVLHISPRCGSDGLLAIGIAKRMFELGITDDDFLQSHASGVHEYRQLLNQYSFEEICEKTDVSRWQLEELVALIRATPHFLLMIGKGMARNTNSGLTVKAISLLPAISGAVGRSGVGFTYNDFQREDTPVWPFGPPLLSGKLRTVPKGQFSQILFFGADAPVRAAWIERANPAVSNPNRSKTIHALESMDFTVVVDHYMTDTAKYADIFLPAKNFLEQNDLVRSYGHPYIQLRQKVIEAPPECKSEREIYSMLAKKFGFAPQYFPQDEMEIIQAVIEASGYKTTIEQLRDGPYRLETYDRIAFSNKQFPTSSGRIQFLPEGFEEKREDGFLTIFKEPEESKYSTPDRYMKYPLQFMSSHANERINSQFGNNEWMTALSSPCVQMHPNDAHARALSSGDKVRIFNDRGMLILPLTVTQKVKEGVVLVYEGGSERTGAVVNTLTNDRLTDIGFGAGFHACLVEVKKEGLKHDENHI